MAQENGISRARVTDRLLSEGHAFEFFQAVRLLELHAREPQSGAVGERFAPTGASAGPSEEAIRFRGHPSLTFAPGEVHEIGGLKSGEAAEPGEWPVGLEVAFLGLIGPQGALPQHYTALAIERLVAGDKTLREFLDLFHHRAVSLFYRAWEKYHFPFLYERFRRSVARSQAEVDPLTFALLSFVGLGTDGLNHKLSVDDESILYYSGHYAHHPRPAVALEALLADFFNAPVEVLQFQGRWITLAPEERTALPSRRAPLGRNCRLGRDAIAGTRVWNVPTKFRVRIGPLSYQRFEEFLPTSAGLRKLCDLVRLYVGPEFTYDVQVVLKREEVPCVQLQGQPSHAARLGWNSWSRIRPYLKDGDEAVFRSVDD
ncbi:MAG TPA: type VI secretion system baseplate subunit TssG [Pirellulaceae bacterium]|nr:type VI secretion system baseplate subunit TssG [Pirellulaceae bacterium]